MPANEKANEIRLQRVYDAPVSAVWDAWTDPEQVAKWWGPRGFTLTTHSKDLRPGGHWSYTMHGPDGTDYENKTHYFVVEPQQKLVYDHGASDDRPPLFRVTVTFEEQNGHTHMDMSMAFPTAEVAAQSRVFIKQANGNSTWDRLAEHLDKQENDRERFVINRSFDAPIDAVFDAWTTPGQLSQWLPPTGFAMEWIQSDIRPGGETRFVMSNEEGAALHARAAYQQVERPRLVVYTQQFCDEQGNVCRHPMAPVWPATMLVIVTLAEEGPRQTRVTVTSEAHGDFTKDEERAFAEARAGMTQGWTGSFDKLEADLADRCAG